MKLHIAVLCLILLTPLAFAQEQATAPTPTCKTANDGRVGSPNPTVQPAGSLSVCKLPDGVSIQGRTTFLVAMIACFVAGAILSLLLALGIRWLWKQGKARVIMINPDAKTIFVKLVSSKGGRFMHEGATYLLDGLAKHGGDVASWLVNVDPEGGYCYTAPTRKEVLEGSKVAAVLSASNPKSYHKVIHRHRWNEVMSAGEEKDKSGMWVALGIIGFFALIAILGTVAWIAMHLPTPGAK